MVGSIIGPNGTTYSPQAASNDNPDNTFRRTSTNLTYNLNTAGLAVGTYTLMIQVGDDPVLYALSFVFA